MARAKEKVLRPEVFLQCHQNPMNVERSTPISLNRRTIGLDEMIQKTVERVKRYYVEPDQDSPNITVIKG